VWHCQALGRGTRAFPGKENFIVLDHSNNCLVHGEIEQEFPCNLDGRETGKGQQEAPVKVCKGCMATVHASFKACPYCGYVFTAKDNESKYTPGVLVKYKPEKTSPLIKMAIKKREGLIRIAMRHSLKRGFVYYKLKDQFGERAAKLMWARRATQEVDHDDLALPCATEILLPLLEAECGFGDIS
jgi:RNA polymerase subunit RPABC4/transcription elongation factor Spt4